MKRISVLLLMLCMVGCNLLPSVIDESIPLPAEVVIDDVDKVPAKPVPSPMPVQAPQPKQEVVKEFPKAAPQPGTVVREVPKQPGHWTFPSVDRTIDQHLRARHDVVPSGMTREEMLDLHDALHETESRGVSQTPAKVKVSTLVQYTIDSCGICKADVRDVFPLWVKQGWTTKIVNETANPSGLYPRYELRGADGSFRTHSGSLRNWK